jgi:hypothetical protein
MSTAAAVACRFPVDAAGSLQRGSSEERKRGARKARPRGALDAGHGFAETLPADAAGWDEDEADADAPERGAGGGADADAHPPSR